MNKNYLINSVVIVIAIIIFSLGYLHGSRQSEKPKNITQHERERVCFNLKQAETYSDTTAQYETVNVLNENGLIQNCLVVTSQGIEWVF